MAQPKTPVPKKRRVLSFVSPKVGDVLFYELRNEVLPKHKSPSYGDAHPNSVLYPNHKLVFIAPATGEEDQWQKWYYAASRDSQDDYNFELFGDDRLVRTYILPRADYVDVGYTPPALGDDDPDVVRFPTYKFTEETVRRTEDNMLDSFFVVVQRTYANVAKTLSETETGTPRGEEGTITEVGASKTATSISPGIILQRSSRLSEYNLWHNTENRLSLRSGVNQSSVSKRPGYTETDTAELSATEPVTAGEPDFGKRIITTDVDGADAIWAANRKTRANDPAQGSETVNFLGGGVADIDISLVADTTSADSGFYIIDSRVSPMGDGDAIKTTKTLDAYPTLIESRYDPSLDAMVTITKDVVAAGTTGSYAIGDITEVQPYDKWRSIQIRTQAIGAETTETLPGVFPFRFPAVLLSAEWIGAYAYASATGDDGVARSDWDNDIALIFDVREPYTAAVDGRELRIITSNPSAVVGSYPPVVFKPESHTIGLAAAGFYASAAMVWAKASARTWQTPMALCAGITLTPPPFTGGEISVNSDYTDTLPATSPAGIPSGWMTIGVTTRKLRMGYTEVLVRQINSPGG